MRHKPGQWEGREHWPDTGWGYVIQCMKGLFTNQKIWCLTIIIKYKSFVS